MPMMPPMGVPPMHPGASMPPMDHMAMPPMDAGIDMTIPSLDSSGGGGWKWQVLWREIGDTLC